MKLTTVSYSRTYPTAQYANEKIGMEASIGENESPEEAIKKIKEICDLIHEKNNPQLYQKAEEYTIPFMNKEEIFNQLDSLSVEYYGKPTQKLSQEETIIRDIHTCTDLKTLQAYKLIAKNNPKIQEHYTAKLSELTK